MLGLVIWKDQNLSSLGHEFSDFASERCRSYRSVVYEMVFRVIAVPSRFAADDLMVFHIILLEPFFCNALMFTCAGGEEANKMAFIEPSTDLFDDVRVGFSVRHTLCAFFVQNVLAHCTVDIEYEDLLRHDSVPSCLRRLRISLLLVLSANAEEDVVTNVIKKCVLQAKRAFATSLDFGVIVYFTETSS